jgi:hypothetical protein
VGERDETPLLLEKALYPVTNWRVRGNWGFSVRIVGGGVDSALKGTVQSYGASVDSQKDSSLQKQRFYYQLRFGVYRFIYRVIYKDGMARTNSRLHEIESIKSKLHTKSRGRGRVLTVQN